MSHIEGVRVKQLQVRADDRGFLYEGLKKTDLEFVEFGQTNFTLSYPGVIKAFHYHRRQWDHWICPVGALQVVLFDLREMVGDCFLYADLPEDEQGDTLKNELQAEREQRTQVVYLTENNPQMLTIPPGVAHGYRVLGEKSAMLVYHVTQVYDPRKPDEQRIAFDDPLIGFNWETVNR